MDRNTVAPRGDPDDIAKMQAKLGPSITIKAVFRTDEGAASNLAWMQVRILGAMPCFWPHLILLSPCLIPAALNTKAALMNSFYVVSDEGIYTVVDDYSPPCGCGCSTGVDYSHTSWENVLSISVNNAGKGCASCQIPMVALQLPGVVSSGSGDNRSVKNNSAHWAVADPQDIAEFLRSEQNAFKQRRSQNSSNNVANVPVAAQIDTKRVFVAMDSNPHDSRILKLPSDTNLNELVEMIQELFEVKVAIIVFMKHGDKKILLSDPSHLEANDEITVSVVTPATPAQI